MTERAAPPRERDNLKRTLLLIDATSYLGPFSQSIYVPSIVALRDAFQTTNVMAGVTVGVFGLAQAVAQLCYGPIADRYSGRNLLLGGVALYVLGGILCFLAPTVELFIVARAIQSAGIAAGIVVGGAIISDRFPPERRGAALSQLQVANAMGAATGPVLGGLLAFFVAWQANFLALAAVGAIILVALWRGLPPMRAHGQPLTVRSIITALTTPATLGVVVVGFSAYFSHFVLFGNGPILYRERFSLPEPVIGALLLGHACGVMTGSIAGGRLSDRWGRRQCILLSVGGMFLACCFYTAVSAVGSGPSAVAALAVIHVVFGFSMGLGVPSSMALIIEWLPVFRGAAVGTYVSFRYLGAAIGPAVGGVVIDWVGLWGPFAVAAVVLLGTALIAALVVRPAPK